MELVQSYDDFWFKNAVTSKLRYFRTQPLPGDFDEDISIAREKKWSEDKKKERHDAENAWGSFPDSDKAAICQTIRKRMQGQINDQEWASFYSSLVNAANNSPDPEGVGPVRILED